MANCDDRCDTFRAIQALPDGASKAERKRLLGTCLACPLFKVKRDKNGRERESDSMQLGGRGAVHLDAADDIDLIMLRSIGGRRCTMPEVYGGRREGGAGRLTDLPPEVERRVRELFAGLFSLRPPEILLMLHLANGGNQANFQDFMSDFIRYWNGRNIKDKRCAWALWKSATGKIPCLQTLFVKACGTRTVKRR